jgi:16S rRNA (cytidine1402-2'-O)-methyltransferase
VSGTLYIVATPIGNLEDITYRAVRILDSVDLIACEDTRQTSKLLAHYKIARPLISYHEHNEVSRTAELLDRLASGASVALVSDAGTPLVADPGYRIVSAAAAAGIHIVPVPGPSSILAALSAAGLPTDKFSFHGFLPSKSGQRQKFLGAVRDRSETLVFLEAPHRLAETLADLREVLGDRPVVLAREVTKLHEEFLRGTPAEILETLKSRPAEVKGEITLLVGKGDAPRDAEQPVGDAVDQAVAAGMDRMEAIKSVARARGLGKREVYRLLQQKS